MSLSQDLKFTVRMLRRNPALAASAILATALGIGAASAMFSVTDGILLHPLPFPRSDRLVNVWESAPSRNLPRLVVAPGNYYDWRVQTRSFSAIGAYQQATFNLGIERRGTRTLHRARSAIPDSSPRSAFRPSSAA